MRSARRLFWLLGGVALLGLGAVGRIGVSAADAQPALSVSVGAEHSCALLADRRVECWGENRAGQLGNGGEQVDPALNDGPLPTYVSGMTNAVAISAGWGPSCAVLSGGAVECWGSEKGLGKGSSGTGFSSVPVVVSGIGDAVSVSAGFSDTCALLADGTVDCWGINEYGQLGDGSQSLAATPVAVSGIAGAVAVSAGSHHSCALLADATVKCWGINDLGELGSGSSSLGSFSTTPVSVVGLGEVSAISAGAFHSCALLRTGHLECWGDNDTGELGDNRASGSFSNKPVAVAGITDAVSVSAGAQHSCAALATGAWTAGARTQKPSSATAKSGAKSASRSRSATRAARPR